MSGKDNFPEPPPSADRANRRIGYYADAPASAEGGALSALFNCLPWENWVVESDDPLLWTMQRGNNWDVPNTHDFGICVRKQREDRSTPDLRDPDSSRGARSAAIIEDRLSRQLLTYGCTGEGPDHCLGLMRALFSLNPKHRDRVAIIKRMESETAATLPEPIPEALRSYNGTTRDSLNPLYEQTRHRLWRKGIVLDLMLAEPQSWTASEMQTRVDAAIAMMLEWRRLDWIVNSAGFHNAREYGFENPWQHLSVNGQMPSTVSARVRQLGSEAAAAEGCALAKLERGGQAPEYWYAYAQTKLQRERQDCRALPMDWIAKQYLEASSKNQRQLLAPIAELAAWVDEKADPKLRDPIRDSIEGQCPEKDWGSDYWGICTHHAAILRAEREREQAKRQAEEREARALQNDPCRNGTLTALQQDFGYGGAEGYPTGNTQVTCKPLPYAAGTAAIAVFHPAQVLSAADEAAGDGDYDLHLLIADKDGEVVAEAREKNAAYSDAVRLDGIGIDTGLYRLASDVRAFGVSTYNAAHCYQCSFSEKKLSLFVREGKILRKILGGLMQSTTTTDGEAVAGCSSPTSDATKSIAIGSNKHSGYADLVITTVTTHSAGYNAESGEECSGGAPAERSSETWIYDGRQYEPARPQAKR